MDIGEKKEFFRLLKQTLAAYGKKEPDSGPLLDAWWNELSPYPLRVVELAFSAYKDENGEFAPIPAGIAKRCVVMDGRPGVEEAWSMFPMDEASSTVWTAEMAEAWGIASPLLDDGDRIAARMAFKESYARLVAQARNAGIAPKWTFTQGFDKSSRQLALIDAVRKHRISVDHALQLLPEQDGVGLLMSLGVKNHPLLSAPTAEEKAKAHQVLSQLAMKDGLK